MATITSYNFTANTYQFLDGATVIDTYFLKDSYLSEPAGGGIEGVLISEDTGTHKRFLSNAELLSMGFASVALFTTQFDTDKATASVGNVLIRSPGGTALLPNIVIGMANTAPVLASAAATSNVIIGRDVLPSITAGVNNTVIGSNIGEDPADMGTGNTIIGTNMFVEPDAAQGSSNVVIGSGHAYNGVYGSSNTIVGRSSWNQPGSGSGNVVLGVSIEACNGAENVLIGSGLGYDEFTGSRNVFIGKAVGKYGTPSGDDNISMGYKSSYGYGDGSHVLSGSDNVIMGVHAAMYGLEGSSNVVIGNRALGYAYGKTSSGQRNIFMGFKAGYYQDGNAGDNIVMGTYSGYNLTSGAMNIFMGYNAGREGLSSTKNIAMGWYSLGQNTTGNYNTSIGYGAGSSVLSGDRNVFIGRYAGQSETGDDTLHVGSLASRTLLGGDFSAGIVTIERAGVILPVTATIASALTPVEGMEVNVSSTDGTFTSTGKWIYQGAAWAKFTVV